MAPGGSPITGPLTAGLGAATAANEGKNPIDQAFTAMQEQIRDGIIVAGVCLVGVVVGAFIVKWLWTKAFPSEYQMQLELQKQLALKWASPEAAGKVVGAAVGSPGAIAPL